MRKSILIIAFAIASFSTVSCNKKETSSYTIIPEDTIHQNYPDTFEPKKDTLQFCYLSVVGKDSLHLSYTLYPTDSVKGKMSYDNFEKDGSIGKVYGIKSGDTLKLTYHMFSEGMHSLIDVRFLTKTINMTCNDSQLQLAWYLVDAVEMLLATNSKAIYDF